MINNYWPWWLGGGLLATVAIAFPLLAGAPLGVSGALAQLLRWWKEIPDGKNESPNRPSAGVPSGCNSTTTTGLNRTANLLFLVGILKRKIQLQKNAKTNRINLLRVFVTMHGN